MIAYGDFSLMSGQHALFRLIDHRPAINAVFAASPLRLRIRRYDFLFFLALLWIAITAMPDPAVHKGSRPEGA